MKPLGIKILSISVGLVGIIFLSFGFAFIFGHNSVFNKLTSFIAASSTFYFGSVTLGLSLGLWYLKDWARIFLLGLGTIGIIFSIAVLPSALTGNLIVVASLFAAITTVWYLSRPNVKKMF